VIAVHHYENGLAQELDTDDISKLVDDPHLLWVDVANPSEDDHVLRAIDLVDSGRELMGNAVDAHLAIISTRMNSVMKKMTSWGAIILGSTLVAGIYGMNFKNMPELHWHYGYLFALGLMLTITVVGYRYFKSKDWL
jgi:magnesium transporter